jgi:hypothetical protein
LPVIGIPDGIIRPDSGCLLFGGDHYGKEGEESSGDKVIESIDGIVECLRLEPFCDGVVEEGNAKHRP